MTERLIELNEGLEAYEEEGKVNMSHGKKMLVNASYNLTKPANEQADEFYQLLIELL